MKQSLARKFPFYAGNLLPLLSTFKPSPHHISPLTSTFFSSSSSNFRRLFSSQISGSSKPNLDQSQNNDVADQLSNEELKMQIQKLYDGDEDAFGSVFKTVLMRKLSGKTDKLDEELINELPNLSGADEDDDSTCNESDSDSENI